MSLVADRVETNSAVDDRESPDHVRMSLAAAMTLGFRGGRFYRGAELHCVNLLTVYRTGCVGSCSYCGLSRTRAPVGAHPRVRPILTPDERRQSFIRVEWPTYSLDDVVERMVERADQVERVCVSMITNKRAPEDVAEIVSRIRARMDVPISVLITPTIMDEGHLRRYRALGVDKVGVAVDAATPELFQRHRGRDVGGPHRWEVYWERFSQAASVFGRGNVGAHLIVGLGETEREMAEAIQQARDLGGNTHLFSFYPEGGSMLEAKPQPPAGQYRRVQLARYLIDQGLSSLDRFAFDGMGRIVGFGVDASELDRLVEDGVAFMTSGCTGSAGRVACNRPYGDSMPGDDIRSYPFEPEQEDLGKIRGELRDYRL